MPEFIPAPCEDCGHVEYGVHYYVIHALLRQIAQDGGDPLPTLGYIGDRTEPLMFRALVQMIDGNSGVGFHNLDQGHPAYALGSRGTVDPEKLGDGPEHNGLFQTLKRFDWKYHDEIQDLSTWEKFCSFAFAAYLRRNR